MAGFQGWPPDAITFYEGLELDNSKPYWTVHKATYEQAVRAPMLVLAELVADEFGPLHLFRPHRDVRFSKDKSPYKTNIGAVTEGEGGEIYYVQLAADGLTAGSGYYSMASDQLARHRAAIDDDDTGPEVEATVTAVEADGYRVTAQDELRTAPRGYKRDHPRIRLLRLKGLVGMRTFEPGPWLSTPAALDRVVDTWRGCQRLNDWLGRHVGPSALPPPDLFDR